MNAKPRPTRAKKIHIVVDVSDRIARSTPLQGRIAVNDQYDHGSGGLKKS